MPDQPPTKPSIESPASADGQVKRAAVGTTFAYILGGIFAAVVVIALIFAGTPFGK
jgi:hypothetical protein